MTARRLFQRNTNAVLVTLLLFAIGLVAFVVSARGQPRALKDGEAVNLAPEIAPRIFKATAERKGGNVVINVVAREILVTKKPPNDKEAKGWIACWTAQEPLTLGKQVRAYNPSGKKLDETAVLKALAKPSAVVCFQRMHKNDPEKPDPFYASLFREDTVMLVFEAKYWLR